MSAVNVDRAEALFAALVQAGARGFFTHEGIGYAVVPDWVVRAYARGRLLRQPADELLRSLVAAHAGEQLVREAGDAPQWVGWIIGRAWAWRLSRLEQAVREGGRAAA